MQTLCANKCLKEYKHFLFDSLGVSVPDVVIVIVLCHHNNEHWNILIGLHDPTTQNNNSKQEHSQGTFVRLLQYIYIGPWAAGPSQLYCSRFQVQDTPSL